MEFNVWLKFSLYDEIECEEPSTRRQSTRGNNVRFV